MAIKAIKQRLKALELFVKHAEYLNVRELVKFNDYMQTRLTGRWPSSSVIIESKFHLRVAIQRFDKMMEC